MKFLKPFNISFEFFPPKSPEGAQVLLQTASLLSNVQPYFFSVTFGACGSTQEGTVETVKTLSQQTNVRVAPHLSCIGSQSDQITDLLQTYKAMNVKRLVALRGDLPVGMEQTGEFKYASDLVALIRKTTGNHFHIEVAAYPEIHPQAKSAHDDILNLKRKNDAGADSAITQFFFNPDAYFYYLDECTKQGISLPITPGIMPITQFATLARFCDICGAEIPRWIRKRLESYGDDIESIKKFGLEVVYNLCQSLIAGGAPGLHFYTLNKSETSLRLLDLLIGSSGEKSNDQLAVQSGIVKNL